MRASLQAARAAAGADWAPVVKQVKPQTEWAQSLAATRAAPPAPAGPRATPPPPPPAPALTTAGAEQATGMGAWNGHLEWAPAAKPQTEWARSLGAARTAPPPPDAVVSSRSMPPGAPPSPVPALSPGTNWASAASQAKPQTEWAQSLDASRAARALPPLAGRASLQPEPWQAARGAAHSSRAVAVAEAQFPDASGLMAKSVGSAGSRSLLDPTLKSPLPPPPPGYEPPVPHVKKHNLDAKIGFANVNGLLPDNYIPFLTSELRDIIVDDYPQVFGKDDNKRKFFWFTKKVVGKDGNKRKFFWFTK
ncbi:hypothetical protein FOA52_001024 [Chlamydomonas sp. UWO 241]|nr:hypothetical protein FOA52_001024 [Chlamydomonas sp. UWO 241]